LKKIWIIALISAVLMFVFGYSFLTSQSAKISSTAEEQRIVNVIVAAKDIPPYTTLTSDMLIVKQTAANAFLTGFFTSVDEVVGSVSTTTIFSGEVLTANRITKDKAAVGLSGKLDDGMRAITVGVDTTQGVANNIRVGNYVDVVVVVQVDSGEVNGQKVPAGMGLTSLYGAGQPANTLVLGENIGQHFSTIILQKIKVVALNDFAGDVATQASPPYSSVTLEVTPADAAKIALVNNNGAKIQLILRPMEDDSIVNENRDTVLKNTQ
jgi:Flp pilus assembly protein CpaB